MSTPVEVLCKVKVQVFTFKYGDQQGPFKDSVIYSTQVYWSGL
jgi:hypothetical protein